MVAIKFLGGREVKRKKTKKCRGIKIVYIVWPGTDRRLYQLWSWWWPEITGGERVLRYSSNLCPSCCLQQKMISTRGKVQGAVCIACYGCGAECVSHVTIICGWRYYFMTSSVKPLKHYGKKLGVNISSCSKINKMSWLLSPARQILWKKLNRISHWCFRTVLHPHKLTLLTVRADWKTTMIFVLSYPLWLSTSQIDLIAAGTEGRREGSSIFQQSRSYLLSPATNYYLYWET